MRIKYILLYLLIGAGLLTSCSTTVEPPIDMSYNYIPIDTGRYYIYNVDSIWIDCEYGINDTTLYQIKETYPSTFIDGMGDTAINVTRYYRSDASQVWTLMTADVWWLKRTTTRLEKREENLTYIKMTYPIDESYTWNGNAYNTLAQQDYFYGTQDISFNNGFVLFNNTITVYHKLDTSNLIQYYLDTETFARNIGLIHKQKIGFTAITSTNSFPYCDTILGGQEWFNVYILNRVKLGSLVTYKLIEYGFE